MKTLHPSGGLAIHYDDGEWVLALDRVDGLTLLAAARDGNRLRYRPEFARARHLPAEGELPYDWIAGVVLGWSPGDQAWHLGLLLNEVLTEARGGRWCELARWSGDAHTPLDLQEAGAALARMMGCRFRVIAPSGAPPVVETVAADEALQPVSDTSERVTPQAAAPPVEPIQLPLEVGNWWLRAIDIGLQWEHAGIWSLGTLWNVLGRIGLGVIFIVLSVLTLRSPYASVQPEFLPYAGLVIGAGLILAGIGALLRALRVEATVVDTEERQVRRHLDLTSDVLASYDFDEIQAVVVTQIAQGGRQRGKHGAPDRMAHEAWLHLLLKEPRQVPGKARDLKPEDAYVTIGYIERTEGDVVEAHFEGRRNSRPPRVLLPHEATTPAQKAALVLAEAIGVDAYIDQR